MQITLNQDEVKQCVQDYVDNNISCAGDLDIVINEDGTVTVGINEKVGTDQVEDTPPLVEKKPRKRREAKHVMVEKKDEPAPEPEKATQDVEVVDPTDEILEEATAQAEADEVEAASEGAAVEEKVQEAEVEKPVSAKPSLFANLKR
ncbi:hypothetical protein P4a_00039 [Klebsiella phage VLCpiP4a]|nr:hypothetical protein P4a_00039 [Klebsiella phage VLCpiP4a]